MGALAPTHFQALHVVRMYGRRGRGLPPLRVGVSCCTRVLSPPFLYIPPNPSIPSHRTLQSHPPPTPSIPHTAAPEVCIILYHHICMYIPIAHPSSATTEDTPHPARWPVPHPASPHGRATLRRPLAAATPISAHRSRSPRGRFVRGDVLTYSTQRAHLCMYSHRSAHHHHHHHAAAPRTCRSESTTCTCICNSAQRAQLGAVVGPGVCCARPVRV
ncbi:hypothetical protein BD413DRAFT_92968 [Trametes elegans]|nr:hypothetical protein BD413DRAFT_92968 [Trametes elegans]